MDLGAPFPLDHRLALVLFVALLLAAATSVVVGWLRLIPPERDPFEAGGPAQKPEGDAFAVFLLANVSLSVLLRIPGLDLEAAAARAASLLPPDPRSYAGLVAFVWFGFIPGLAAAYSAVRANPLRGPLLLGGILTLLLWFLSPSLLASIAGV
jgi:hypothetical protein